MGDKVAVKINDGNRAIVRELMELYGVAPYYQINDFTHTFTISYEYQNNTLTYSGWQFKSAPLYIEWSPYMYLFTQEFKDRFNIE